MMTPNPKRKKWTESEEKTLIDKYGEMIADGSLAKMKTREKKYRPIASHVNSLHHIRDPIAFPWHWTWKDVSTKVQNMRHQYLLVKQKVKKSSDIISPLVDNNSAAAAAAASISDTISNVDEFDWVEGLTHWSNFLRYKDIFGDVPISFSNNSNNNSNNGSDLMLLSNEDRENASFIGAARGMEIAEFGQMGQSGGEGDFAGIENENGVLGSGFEYEGEQGGENYNGNDRLVDDGYAYEEVEPNGHHNLKKRKVLRGLEKRAFGFLVNQMGQLRELETRLEQREVERQRERQKREQWRMEIEKEWERKLEERERNKEEKEKGREKISRQRLAEWEAMDKESEERETRRKEELIQEREWEERMNRTRSDWKKRIDEMLSQHRAEMGQIQSCILHEQQNLTSQLLGIVSQWTGQPTGLSDHTGASNHYLSQMMQNLHHVNGMVNGDARVDGDNQEDHQFIVDG